MLEPRPRENDLKEMMKKISRIPLREKSISSDQSNRSKRTGHFQWETSYQFWFSELYHSSSSSRTGCLALHSVCTAHLSARYELRGWKKTQGTIGCADTFILFQLMQQFAASDINTKRHFCNLTVAGGCQLCKFVQKRNRQIIHTEKSIRK